MNLNYPQSLKSQQYLQLVSRYWYLIMNSTMNNESSSFDKSKLVPKILRFGYKKLAHYGKTMLIFTKYIMIIEVLTNNITTRTGTKKKNIVRVSLLTFFVITIKKVEKWNRSVVGSFVSMNVVVERASVVAVGWLVLIVAAERAAWSGRMGIAFGHISTITVRLCNRRSASGHLVRTRYCHHPISVHLHDPDERIAFRR